MLYKKIKYMFSLISNRHLSRFFDYLAHPNLSATLATDQKLHLGLDALSNQKS